MFGVLLVAVATLVGEAGQVVSKQELRRKKETPAELAFINLLFATVIMTGVVLFVPTQSFVGSLFGGYVFDLDSLPFFVARFVLELLVMGLIITALAKASRATFSFLRLTTIPLLLVVDILLGYELSILEVIGIAVVVLTTTSMFFTRTLKRNGMWYVLSASVIAVGTVSLYKYNISNFNSVAGEQITMLSCILFTLFFVCLYKVRQNPFRHLVRPRGLLQALLAGLTSVIISVALSLGPASIIITVKRITAIMWAVLAGKHFFHEQHTGAKLAGLGILTVGILLLTGLS